MQIIICCLSLIIISVFVPQRQFKTYMFLSSIIMSGLYFFIDPNVETDLYRHYELFRIVEKFEISNVAISSDNQILQLYSENNVIYFIFLLIISRFHIPQLLPFIVGMIVYNLQFELLNKSLEKYNAERWKYILGYIISLLTIDFVSISGIRNYLALIIFIYFTYIDLVEKRQRLLCFIMYLFCTSIHTMCGIFLIIRFVILIMNRYTRQIIKVVFLFAFIAIPYIYSFIQGSILDIPYLNKVMSIFFIYIDVSKVQTGYLFWCSGLFYLLLGLLLYCYRKVSNNSKLNDYSDFVVLSLLFTIGSFSEYNLFVRYGMIASSLVVIYLMEIIGLTGGKKILSIQVQKKRDQWILILLYTVIVVSLFYFVVLCRVRYVGWTPLF